jgi:hypothetical protein
VKTGSVNENEFFVLYGTFIEKCGPLDFRNATTRNCDDSWWKNWSMDITRTAMGELCFQLVEKSPDGKDVDMFGVLSIFAGHAIKMGNVEQFATCYLALHNLIEATADKEIAEFKMKAYLSVCLIFCARHATVDTSRKIALWCLMNGATILFRSFSSFSDWGKDLHDLAQLSSAIREYNSDFTEKLLEFEAFVTTLLTLFRIDQTGRVDYSFWKGVMGFSVWNDVAPLEWIQDRLSKANISIRFQEAHIAYPRGEILAKHSSFHNVVTAIGVWKKHDGVWFRGDFVPVYTQCVVGGGRDNAFTRTAGHRVNVSQSIRELTAKINDPSSGVAENKCDQEEDCAEDETEYHVGE